MKTTCFLNDIADYAAFNEVYVEFFPDEATRPARTCFGPGGLPKGGLVEVEAIAAMEC
jgi:2-iminobutanoate/2-iminopropanoate deaminase|tara:strand:+ start:1024 stop:1197 length:174 start_codon:yes stop_codon:yes gene_type:complete